MIDSEFTHPVSVSRLPTQVRAMLRTACRTLSGTDAEVTAVDVVSHVPDGIPPPTLLALVRAIAAEYGCVASVAVANGAMEVRLCRREAPRR